jgi:hypothetical protein
VILLLVRYEVIRSKGTNWEGLWYGSGGVERKIYAWCYGGET